jgi:hypothetical protein
VVFQQWGKWGKCCSNSGVSTMRKMLLNNGVSAMGKNDENVVEQ